MADETSIFRIDFEGSDEIIEKIAAIRKEQEKLKELQPKLSEASKSGILAAGKAYEENAIQIKSYGKEISTLTKTIENQNKANKSASGAYDQLSAQYSMLKKELNAMGEAERQQTQRGRDMEAQSKKVYEEMKRLQAATGAHQLNVGNYNEALELTNMSLGEMKKELRELRNMSFSGLKPEEIQAVKGQISQLTEGIRDFQEEVTTASESGIPGIVAGLQGIIASAQLVTGTLSIFGVENEKLEKTMIQLIGVAQGLATVEDMLAKRKLQVMAIQIKEIAVKGYGIVATKAATVAQWLWNAAMYANPIGLIIAGVAALAAGVYLLIRNFDKITGAIKKAWEWMQFWKDSTDEAIVKTESLAEKQERLNKAFDKSSSAMEFEIKMLKALGADQEKIIEKEQDLLEIKMKHLLATAARMQLDRTATAEQKAAAVEQARLAQEELQIFITSNETRKKLEAEKLKDEQGQRAQSRRTEREKEIQAEKEKQEREDKNLSDALVREEKAALELAVLNAETDESRTQARIEQIRRLSELELENAELTESERLLIQAEAFNAEQELLNAQDEIELERIKNQSDREAEIKDQDTEREKQRLLDLQKFEQEITDARIDTAYALLDTFKTIGGEQSKIGKLAKAIQKGIALVEIGINLQRELAAIRVAAAAQNALIPGSGLITERIQSIRAIAQAGAGIAQIMAFNKGGSVPGSGNRDTVPAMLTPGEGVLTKSAMTSADQFTVSGTPKQIASRLNTLYGGVEFRNRGGIIGTGQAAVSTRAASDKAAREDFAAAIAGLTIVTTVEDLNNAVSSEAIRNQMASYV